MSGTRTTTIDRARRRLRRIEGTVNMKTTSLSSDRRAIDFDLGFPEGRKTEVPEYRRTGPEQTAIIVDDDGRVTDFQMRLGSLPQNDSTEAEMEGWVESLVVRAGTVGEYTVRIADDRMAWTPHLDLDYLSGPTLSVSQAVDDLNDIWSLYREQVREYEGDLPPV